MKPSPSSSSFSMLLLGNAFALQGATLPHQGRVLDPQSLRRDGVFPVALSSAGNLVWNHQGTDRRTHYGLDLDAKGGFYSIAFGDPSMADLPASLYQIMPA